MLKTNIATFYFLKAGLQTTIQDSGRFGYQSHGVPVSGVMDKQSAALANRLVANLPDAPVLEITLLGPSIRIEGDCQIAITGANLSPKINNQAIPNYQTINVKTGDILSFGAIRSGCRAYLAIGGNWLVPKWLGSYSALPFNGKKATPHSYIQKGSQLRVETKPPITPKKIIEKEQPKIFNPLKVQVLPGPEFELFSVYDIGYFFSKHYRITSDSNRMGYRLDTKIIDFKPPLKTISSGIVPGTIQITNAGQAVILMTDAQTVGGYPRIAVVLSDDMDKLAQLKPGDGVGFELVY